MENRFFSQVLRVFLRSTLQGLNERSEEKNNVVFGSNVALLIFEAKPMFYSGFKII